MIEIDSSATGEPLEQPWRAGIAVGRAFELLRADVQDHLRIVQRTVGFRWCRFHGLFHDDMQVVVRSPDGALRYQWGHVAKVFDYLLSIGLRPFVELNSMPGALASNDTTFFYWRMNVSPPRHWEEWEALVESLARWACARYGVAEVRTWRFEVWNEPNLGAFWTGTRQDYAELYRRSVSALKRVDPDIQIGGPASAEGGWVEDFLCGEGRDADFVSTHLYPMNEFATFASREESPFVPGRYMGDRLRALRAVTRGKPFYITEWNSIDASDRERVDWFDNPTVDSIASAAVTARMGIELAGVVDGLFWWVASDVFEEAGMPQSPFSGTYGLLTVDGLPKPSFHAFAMLRALQGRRCEVTGEIPEGAGLAAAEEGGFLRALLWNHVPPGLPPRPWSVAVAPRRWNRATLISILHLRPGRGSAYEMWVAMGRPQNPTPTQFEVLRCAATPESRTWRAADAELPIAIELDSNEIALIEWAPEGDPYVPKEILSEQSMTWNSGLAAVPPISGAPA